MQLNVPSPHARFDDSKLAQALAMRPEERALAGPQLFDYACSITMQGIRDRHPEATAEQWLEKLRWRLSLLDEPRLNRPC